jgi:hypothetical protein
MGTVRKLKLYMTNIIYCPCCQTWSFSVEWALDLTQSTGIRIMLIVYVNQEP